MTILSTWRTKINSAKHFRNLTLRLNVSEIEELVDYATQLEIDLGHANAKRKRQRDGAGAARRKTVRNQSSQTTNEGK